MKAKDNKPQVNQTECLLLRRHYATQPWLILTEDGVLRLVSALKAKHGALPGPYRVDVILSFANAPYPEVQKKASTKAKQGITLAEWEQKMAELKKEGLV